MFYNWFHICTRSEVLISFKLVICVQLSVPKYLLRFYYNISRFLGFLFLNWPCQFCAIWFSWVQIWQIVNITIRTVDFIEAISRNGFAVVSWVMVRESSLMNEIYSLCFESLTCQFILRLHILFKFIDFLFKCLKLSINKSFGERLRVN